MSSFKCNIVSVKPETPESKRKEDTPFNAQDATVLGALTVQLQPVHQISSIKQTLLNKGV